MPLKSRLFRGDAKLDACLVSDPAHVTPGSRGSHVEKIQIALNLLDDAGLRIDGIYGPATAAAVRRYKNHPSRRILRPDQTTADDIVGRGTIASLDRELIQREIEPGPTGFRIEVVKPVARPATPAALRGELSRPLSLRGLRDASGAALVRDSPPPAPVTKLRLQPRQTGELRVIGSSGGAFLMCRNSPPPKGDHNDKVAWVWNPAEIVRDRLAPEPFGSLVRFAPEQEGGSVILTGDPATANVDAFRPGDALVTGANGAGALRSVQIEVRAVSAGRVPRPPLTKLEPGSKFFSASAKNGGEFDPHGVFTGRPVNPRRGGKLINLGGEQETPEFEDYQVNLGFSGYARSFTGNRFVFRPFTDDADPAVRVADRSASHICIRGNPLTNEFIAVIRRIAAGGCLFTFSGATNHAQRAIAELAGTVLEQDLANGQVAIELR